MNQTSLENETVNPYLSNFNTISWNKTQHGIRQKSILSEECTHVVSMGPFCRPSVSLLLLCVIDWSVQGWLKLSGFRKHLLCSTTSYWTISGQTDASQCGLARPAALNFLILLYSHSAATSWWIPFLDQLLSFASISTKSSTELQSTQILSSLQWASLLPWPWSILVQKTTLLLR